jgi:hypothetical protein
LLCPRNDFAQSLPTFEQFNESFKFDDGHSFVAGKTAHVRMPARPNSDAGAVSETDSRSFDWGRRTMVSLYGGVLGSIGGILVWLVRRVALQPAQAIEYRRESGEHNGLFMDPQNPGWSR